MYTSITNAMSSDHANDFSTYQKETHYYFGKPDRYRVKKQLVTTTEDGQEVRGMEEDASALDRCAIDFFAGLKDEQTRPRNSTFPKSLKNDTGDGTIFMAESQSRIDKPSFDGENHRGFLASSKTSYSFRMTGDYTVEPNSIITRVQSNGRPKETSRQVESPPASDNRSDFKMPFRGAVATYTFDIVRDIIPDPSNLATDIVDSRWYMTVEEMYPSSVDVMRKSKYYLPHLKSNMFRLERNVDVNSLLDNTT